MPRKFARSLPAWLGQALRLGGVDREDDPPLVDRLHLGRVDEAVAAGPDGGVEDDAVEDVALAVAADADDAAEPLAVAGVDGSPPLQHEVGNRRAQVLHPGRG